MLPSPLEISIAFVIALLVAALVFAMANVSFGRVRLRSSSKASKVQTAVFLFDKDTLVDASDLASWLIEEKFDQMSDWDALLLLLKDDFPNFEGRLPELSENPDLQLASLFDHDLQLLASKINGRLKIELRGMAKDRTPDLIQKLEQRSTRAELDRLRSIADATPQLIWQEGKNGEILWCNKSYLRFVDLRLGRSKSAPAIWPSEKLFPGVEPADANSAKVLQSKHQITLQKDDAEYWFNIASFPIDESTIHFASDANEEMRSERGQKAFIQTFAKTFAQLSVGLAIFDKSRNLTMFNPAMLEMSGLPINFLSTRPSVESVFDRMRAIGKLPEPKNYAEWRDQFNRMMDQDNRESYQDTWALLDGQVYRVTGRPHPDGAFAFLFEDISAEVSLTRRFRSEIETGQAVLDTIADPIAVFSPSQTLVLTNFAYSEMWNNPDHAVAASDLKSALRTWKARSAPSPLWSKLESFAVQTHDRNAWKDEFLLRDGRVMCCDVSPLLGGMTLIKFSQPQKLGQTSKNGRRRTTVALPRT